MSLLSIVIPVYNEERTLEKIIDLIHSGPIKDFEIIVVDDKSTDDSRKIATKLFRQAKIDRLFFKKLNGGKGSALKIGFKLAKGEIVIIQDADLEYDPYDYARLILPITQDRADVVYGSRFTGSQPHRVLYFWHYVANMLLTIWSNIFTNLNLTDMETGYKVFKREVIQSINLEERSFGIEPEITAKLSQMNLRIYEVGASYHGRTYNEGKKIQLKDFFIALWAVVKYSRLGQTFLGKSV